MEAVTWVEGWGQAWEESWSRRSQPRVEAVLWGQRWKLGDGVRKSQLWVDVVSMVAKVG